MISYFTSDRDHLIIHRDMWARKAEFELPKGAAKYKQSEFIRSGYYGYEEVSYGEFTPQIQHALIKYIKDNLDYEYVIEQTFRQYENTQGLDFKTIYKMMLQDRSNGFDVFDVMITAYKSMYYAKLPMETLFEPILWGEEYDNLIYHVSYSSVISCYEIVKMCEKASIPEQRIIRLVQKMSSDVWIRGQIERLRPGYGNVVSCMVQYGHLQWATRIIQPIHDRPAWTESRDFIDTIDSMESLHNGLSDSMKSLHSESSLFFEERKQLLLEILEHDLFRGKPRAINAFIEHATPWSIQLIMQRHNLFKIRDMYLWSFRMADQSWLQAEKEAGLIKLTLDTIQTQKSYIEMDEEDLAIQELRGVPFDKTITVHEVRGEQYIVRFFHENKIKTEIESRIQFYLRHTGFPEEVIALNLFFEFTLLHPHLKNECKSMLRGMVLEQSKIFAKAQQ